MNKQKLLLLFLLISITGYGNLAWAEDPEIIKIQDSKKLKGGVSDYRAEFINQDWWDKFNDTTLSSYIDKAAYNNQDLKIATLRVAEYQALVRESLGREMPTLNVGGNYDLQRTSGNARFGSFRIASFTQSSFNFPLIANYELDIWGKNRQKTIKTSKELDMIKHDEKAAYIALTSAVASTYFNLAKMDKFIELQKKIVSLKQEKLDLINEKKKYGLSASPEVISAEQALTQAQSTFTEYKKQQNILTNQLAILTGENVDESLSLKRSSIDDINIIKDLPLTVEPETVLNRPDILKSEAQLQASRIDVSLARKDFLPSINITGQSGFNANSLSKVFNWDSYATSLGANVLQGLFSGGQRLARLKVKKVRYEEMIQNYQKTILESFQDVNDSLVSLKSDIKKNDDSINRSKLEKDQLNLIVAKFEHGLVSHLDTLDYRERVLTLKKDEIQSKTDCLIDSLSLYKSVGGKL